MLSLSLQFAYKTGINHLSSKPAVEIERADLWRELTSSKQLPSSFFNFFSTMLW